MRAAAVNDWNRAISHYNKSIHVIELIMGRENKMFDEVIQLLEVGVIIILLNSISHQLIYFFLISIIFAYFV